MKKEYIIGIAAALVITLLGGSIGGLIASSHKKTAFQGAFIASPTGLTDVAIENDLTVGGILTALHLSVTNTSTFATSTFSGLTTLSSLLVSGLSSLQNLLVSGTFGVTGTSTLATTTISNLNVTTCVGCGSGLTSYAEFYGLTAGTGNGGSTDYAATIAVHTSAGTGRVPFPRLATTFGGIVTSTLATTTAFILPNPGVYEVSFKVHTTEPGELQIEQDGTALAHTTTANMNPTSGGHLIAGTFLVTVTNPTSTISIINPAGNSPALTITPADGASTNAVAQNLVIKRVN